MKALFDDEAKEPGEEAVEEDDKDHKDYAVGEDGAGHFPGGFAVGPADAADFAPRVADVAAEGDEGARKNKDFFQRFFFFAVFFGFFGGFFRVFTYGFCV